MSNQYKELYFSMLISKMISANFEEYKRLSNIPRYYEVEFHTGELKTLFRCDLLEKSNLPAEVLIFEIWKDYLLFACARTFMGPSNEEQALKYEKNKMDDNKLYRIKFEVTNGNVKIIDHSGFSFFKKTFQMYEFLIVTHNLFKAYPNKLMNEKKDEYSSKCFFALHRSMKAFYYDRIYESNIDRFLMKFLEDNESLYAKYLE